mgnify:CR=1 FL=1
MESGRSRSRSSTGSVYASVFPDAVDVTSGTRTVTVLGNCDVIITDSFIKAGGYGIRVDGNARVVEIL